MRRMLPGWVKEIRNDGYYYHSIIIRSDLGSWRLGKAIASIRAIIEVSTHHKNPPEMMEKKKSSITSSCVPTFHTFHHTVKMPQRNLSILYVVEAQDTCLLIFKVT